MIAASDSTARPKASRGAARLHQFINPATLILVAAVALTVLGVTVLFSASMSIRTDPYFFVRRQVCFVGAALIIGFLAARLNFERLRRFTWWLVAAVGIGLVLVLIPGIGVEVNGSRRWFEFGPIRLQVSDCAKVAMVYALAHYLANNHKDIGHVLKGFVYPLGGVGLCALLILLEPDFGTAMLVGAVGATMLWLAGARLIYLIPSVLLGAAALGVAIMHNPVRLARITSFMDVEANRSDGAYQLWQAILAFGAGGVQGVGIGNGRQQMAFLPEAHTDFIFAIVGEELGLAVTLGVVVVFALIFMAGVMHMRRAPNLFQYLLVGGCLMLLTTQAIINLGVVTGLLPTKGMSLPFISYGGSNLMLMATVVGVMLNTQTAWSRPLLRDRDTEFKEVAA
jgi:cell division protein FtsW